MTREEINKAADEYATMSSQAYKGVYCEYCNDKIAFLAGVEWMKKEILKNVVLETKVMEDSDGDGIETPYEKWLTLENTEIPFIPENIGLKDGDKIKIIVFKDE